MQPGFNVYTFFEQEKTRAVMSLSWYARKLTKGTAGFKKSKRNRGGEKQAAKPDGEDSA